MMAVCILVSVVYTAMIVTLFLSSFQPEINNKKSVLENKRFSVVVAARNESQNIMECVRSLLSQDYPTSDFEVIIVDDHSTDNTSELLATVDGIKTLLLQAEKGKKAAIAMGINAAKFEYIAVTDADCIAGPHWLKTLNLIFNRKQADLVTGPVKVLPCNGMVSAFEAMDAAIMMRVTAFGIQKGYYFLANGANMSFSKKCYQDLGGYHSHNHYASGDDVFFYAEAARRGMVIDYAAEKEAIVTTRPQASFKALLNQRRRWATKTRAYAGRAIWLIQATVAGTHLFLLCLLILGFFMHEAWKGALLLAAVKWILDFVALWKSTGWQNNRVAMKHFLSGQFIYGYIILFSAWHALFPGKYVWKGREVN